MPTPKAAAIFQRLVTARERLNDITKQLNALDPAKSQLGSERRQLLELQWDQAFHSFEAVTKEFYESVKEARNQLGSEPSDE